MDLNQLQGTCPLCTTFYNDPRLLPCTHTFCLACIQSFTNCKDPGDQVQCVLCNSEFTIPENGIDGLPKNIFIAKLSSQKRKVSKHRSTTDTSSVSSLKSVPSIPTVEDNISSASKTKFAWRSKSAGHLKTSDSTAGHGFRSKRDSVACMLHRDKNIELYCHDCSSSICVLCYIEDHSCHRCSDIAKVADWFQEEMSNDVSKIAGGINRCLEAQEILARGRMEYADRAIQITAEIEERAEQLKQKIDSDKAEIIHRLKAIERDYISDMDVMSKIIDRQATHMVSYEKMVTQLSDQSILAEIVSDSHSLHEKAAQLLSFDAIENAAKCTLESNEFNLFVDTTEQQRNIIGELVHEKTFKGWVDMKPNLTPIVLRHVILKGFGQPIYSVATLCDMIYVIRFRSAIIEVYNATTLSLERTMPLATIGADPRGIAACPVYNCLYVSDHMNMCVHRVELGAKTSVDMWPTVTEPAGLSINNVNNVLVTFTRNSRIKEFTTGGELVRVIFLRPFITSPWHCVQLPASGRFVVSHSCPSRGVSVLDPAGKLLHTIQNYTSASGEERAQMNTPRGLLVAGPLGTVLVADFKRILVLDQSLAFSRELPMSVFSSLKQPYALSFDEARCRLYVVDRSRGRAMVFDNVILPLWSSKSTASIYENQ